MTIQKTLECCGRKPKREFWQTSFRDDEGTFILKCRNKDCKNKVEIYNEWRGVVKVEIKAVEEWNKLIKNEV